MAPFPSFGGLGVYWNWALLNPLLSLHMYFRDFGHTRSPLSSTTLVHRAFFCFEFPTSGVQEFEPNMPEYESLLWPLGMMFPFVNVRNVLRNIVGWAAPLKTRLFVVSGSKDTLMGVVLMRRMTEQYRQAFVALIRRKVLQVGLSIADVDDKDGSAAAVGFTVIEGAGHHIQNDLQWEDAASQILAFFEQL
ncbi:hypothetical protein Hypma_011950 [Hypsizygus marmoreus]|uniref:Uncharacterized protein n=1 Tax=Hypsizygus marmoreus TaxID=39966 RepID=A0A369JIA1_HYPMA|nr:hypothetical protein Hypma_011950 [Hypsizygus marmoreus]